MARISCISTIKRDTMSLQHESAPQPLPSVTHGTFAPVLCRQKRYFQFFIFQLLIPAGLNHLHFRKPTLYQFSVPNPQKQFHLRIVIQQTGYALFIQMVKMIMTNEQVINSCKMSGLAGNSLCLFKKGCSLKKPDRT